MEVLLNVQGQQLSTQYNNKYIRLASNANSFNTRSNDVIFSVSHLKLHQASHCPARLQHVISPLHTSFAPQKPCHLPLLRFPPWNTAGSFFSFHKQTSWTTRHHKLSSPFLQTPNWLLLIFAHTWLPGPQTQSLKQFSQSPFLPQLLGFLVSTMLQEAASNPHPAGEPFLPWWTMFPQTVSQSKASLPSFRCFYQIFCHGTEKTTTMGLQASTAFKEEKRHRWILC